MMADLKQDNLPVKGVNEEWVRARLSQLLEYLFVSYVGSFIIYFFAVLNNEHSLFERIPPATVILQTLRQAFLAAMFSWPTVGILMLPYFVMSSILRRVSSRFSWLSLVILGLVYFSAVLIMLNFFFSKDGDPTSAEVIDQILKSTMLGAALALVCSTFIWLFHQIRTIRQNGALR